MCVGNFENPTNLEHTFFHFSYIKIPHILCVAHHKLNGVHDCFIMKSKKVLNRFFSYLCHKCDYD